MRINHKILSIPPYISTSWKNIASLHVEEVNTALILMITLHSGAQIEVPGLQQHMIEAIFVAHAAYMEQEAQNSTARPLPQRPIPGPVAPGSSETIASFSFPLMKIGIDAIENIGGFLQHSMEQADAPDLPADMLSKIATMAKSLGIDENVSLPEAEPHCNCPHCQIARALDQTTETPIHPEEQGEPVLDDELKFRTWDITQTAEKLYLVKNPLAEKEEYHVFLGQPIGCTCGCNNCEHIRAVLNN